jgi:uncharacterized protein YjbI with pentapeptide repeats
VIMVQSKKEGIYKVKTGMIKRFVTGLAILATLMLLGWICWKTYQAGNLGFSGKTLWDWMELLVVPAILALLVFLLNKSQKDTELKIADMRRTEERVAAEQRAAIDRELEKDRQRQKSLEDYLDRMTDLLLENGLRVSSASDEIRSIARTRTLTILRGLDGYRRSQLLQFLYESNLIGKISEPEIEIIKPILDLSFADLSELNFAFGNLCGVSLPKANLRTSNFHASNLVGANFYHADLDDSDFSWAKLMGANLCAGLIRVNLSSANLEKAILKQANLTGARLWHTTFKGANLQFANFLLKNPYFRDKSNLEPATLMNVDFTDADLKNAIISATQLLGARSLSGAVMPNGQLFDEWKKTHSLRDMANIEANSDSFEGIDLYDEDGNSH